MWFNATAAEGGELSVKVVLSVGRRNKMRLWVSSIIEWYRVISDVARFGAGMFLSSSG